MPENQLISKASLTKSAHIGFAGIYWRILVDPADSSVSTYMAALTIRSSFPPRM